MAHEFDVTLNSKDWNKDVLEDEYATNLPVVFRLTHKTTDLLCARISAGGTDKVNYLTYRGELQDIKVILENCLKVVNSKLEKQKT